MKYLSILFALLLGCGAAHAQVPFFTCTNATHIQVTGAGNAGNTQIVAAPALGRGANIYVCSFSLQVLEPSTPITFALTNGTGTNCATGTATVSPTGTGQATSYPSIGQAYTSDSAPRVPTNNALCMNLSGATTYAMVDIRYVVY